MQKTTKTKQNYGNFYHLYSPHFWTKNFFLRSKWVGVIRIQGPNCDFFQQFQEKYGDFYHLPSRHFWTKNFFLTSTWIGGIRLQGPNCDFFQHQFKENMVIFTTYLLAIFGLKIFFLTSFEDDVSFMF